MAKYSTWELGEFLGLQKSVKDTSPKGEEILSGVEHTFSRTPSPPENHNIIHSLRIPAYCYIHEETRIFFIFLRIKNWMSAPLIARDFIPKYEKIYLLVELGFFVFKNCKIRYWNVNFRFYLVKMTKNEKIAVKNQKIIYESTNLQKFHIVLDD